MRAAALRESGLRIVRCSVHGCDGWAQDGRHYCLRCREEIEALETMQREQEGREREAALAEVAAAMARRTDDDVRRDSKALDAHLRRQEWGPWAASAWIALELAAIGYIVLTFTAMFWVWAKGSL